MLILRFAQDDWKREREQRSVSLDQFAVFASGAAASVPIAEVGAQPASVAVTTTNRRASRTWLEIGAVVLLFALLTTVMTWPWPLYMGDALRPVGGDMALQMTVMRWDFHAIFTNPLGLFEAFFLYPYAHTLAFSDHLIGEVILALPILLLTGNIALAFNVNIFLSFILTGLFTYLLVRDLTGSRAAGILAGVAFAFCPFRFMQLEHLNILATAWFPLVFWGLYRGQWSVVGGQSPGSTQPLSLKWLSVAAFGIVMMGLSSVYYFYFLLVALLVYVAWWLVAGGWSGERLSLREVRWLPLLARVGVVGLVAALVLLPFLIPYAQSSAELGFSRTTYELQNWSAEWSFYGNVMTSNWLYGQVLSPFVHMTATSGERQLFPGILPVLLALVGLVWGRGRPRFFYLLLGLFSLAMTFGLSRTIPGTTVDVPLPYAFFYDWMPGFKALRVPVRFSILLDLSIYVLAGYGLATILRKLFAGPLKWPASSTKSPEATVSARAGGLRNGNPRASRGHLVAGAHRVLRPVLTILAVALVLLEFANPLDASKRSDLMAELNTIEPYGWLAQPQNAGPVLELPMSADQPDVLYMLYSTRNWQPLVDGWNAFVPLGSVALAQALGSFPDATTLAMVQGLEVRHVVVHLWKYPANEQAAFKKRLDSTRQLKLVDSAGDNYVYELAPDPWLRRMAQQVGSGTLWVGEPRFRSMPSLEVLAYALTRWGVEPGNIAGNIDIVYRPLGSLPFGTPPDYVLLPAGDSLPLDNGEMQQVESNPAVRLFKRAPGLVRSYDFTQPGAANPDLSNMQMGVGASSIAFVGNSSGGEQAQRSLNFYFAANTPSDITLKAGGQTTNLHIPAGVSRYTTPNLRAPQQVSITRQSGDARLLRADLWDANGVEQGTGAVQPQPNLMPIEVSSSKGKTTLDATLRVVAPAGKDNLTITLDTYIEPWGTHPQGHFGSWSVVLPADGAGHTYQFQLDPLTKTVTTTRDGQPTDTFPWQGPPESGGFRTTLTILSGQTPVANIVLNTFSRQGSRLTGWQLASPVTEVVQQVGK